MSEEYGADIITLTDDDGNEYELEHLDTIELNGRIYMAFFPLTPPEDGVNPAEEEDYSMIILRLETQEGEDFLVDIQDEDELEAAYAEFMQSLFEEDDQA